MYLIAWQRQHCNQRSIKFQGQILESNFCNQNHVNYFGQITMLWYKVFILQQDMTWLAIHEISYAAITYASVYLYLKFWRVVMTCVAFYCKTHLLHIFLNYVNRKMTLRTWDTVYGIPFMSYWVWLKLDHFDR